MPYGTKRLIDDRRRLSFPFVQYFRFTEKDPDFSPKVNFGEAEILKNGNKRLRRSLNASGQDEFSVKLISVPQ